MKKFGLILLGLTIVFIVTILIVFKPQIPLVLGFISPDLSKLKSGNSRVNILIMGKAGKDHAGGDLTDTMILVSVPTKKSDIVMISIPRDIWIPETRAKINSSYHYGGTALAKSTVQEILGIPVHYTIVLDFSGFRDVINAMGGINVNVENSFTDPLYPIAGRENDLCNGDVTFKCRYESITFKSGPQLMNGETALKFVRSRHAEGNEGTDIAREARQQKVIGAIENKFMDPKVFLNPKKDLAIIKVVMSSVETDIDNQTVAILTRLVFNARKSVTKYLIPDNLLINPPISKTYDKQYVFTPKLGNGRWEEIHGWVSNLLLK